MIIRKYEAETENDAIMKAREDLGKDAIVMNIKTVKPKGIFRFLKKTAVEVTAAVDENTLAHKPDLNDGFASQTMAKEPPVYRERQAEGEPVYQSPLAAKPDKSYAIEEKLDSLQKLLEQQLQEQTQEETKAPAEEKEDSEETACLKLIYNQLINSEVAEKYANQLMDEIERALRKKDTSVDNILAMVYQKIILKLGQPEEIQINEGETNFVVFIGPTGVGKTTTIAKIASCFQLDKKAKIAMITADTYRIAAVEQLRTYAGILGIPLKVVYSAAEMEEAVEEFDGYDLVFVDTAGRSHKNQEQQEDLKQLLDAIPEEKREIYLVLSAATKYRDLEKITESYREITDYKLIFTKFDETSGIGNIYNIRMLTNASLSYATWGQNVPDDIGRLDVQDIAKQLLGGN
jgi:flagellar biosynthesis protein FlhF